MRFLIVILSSIAAWSLSVTKILEHTRAPFVPPVHVMAIGGSIVKGDDDPSGDSYLERAFQSLGAHTHTKYVYFNKAIYGANGTQLATMYKGQYETWLKQIHPGVVVISWGLLNDALPNTAMAAFQNYIRQEIQEALSAKAIVLVVTPPVTEAAVVKYPTQEFRYVVSEMNLVKQLHNPNVVGFDLFDQMLAYLRKHHQTYAMYEGDANHPNRAGHILAGRLLYQDMLNHYGEKTSSSDDFTRRPA